MQDQLENLELCFHLHLKVALCSVVATVIWLFFASVQEFRFGIDMEECRKVRVLFHVNMKTGCGHHGPGDTSKDQVTRPRTR
ncbi:unnamed protein product [Gadus morhua 'NCC']